MRSVQEAIAGGHTQGLAPKESAILQGATIYETGGCALCEQSGYVGRKGIFEALTVTEQLEELIAAKASVVDIRQMAERQGMRTLRQSGLGLVAAGQTSIDEVLATTAGGAGGAGGAGETPET